MFRKRASHVLGGPAWLRLDVVDFRSQHLSPAKAASHVGPQHLIKAMKRIKDLALQEDMGWNVNGWLNSLNYCRNLIRVVCLDAGTSFKML